MSSYAGSFAVYPWIRDPLIHEVAWTGEHRDVLRPGDVVNSDGLLCREVCRLTRRQLRYRSDYGQMLHVYVYTESDEDFQNAVKELDE